MTNKLCIELNQLIVPVGECVLLQNVSWQQFKDILSELGEQRSSRVAYYDGILEIMVPLPEHEYFKSSIGDLVKDLADELGIEYECFGSTTWKKQKGAAGAEPDECFYIQNFPAIRGRLDIDLSQDPPPDLVLEIDITSKSLDSLLIYARLGVSEVWRYDRNQLLIYQLVNERYVETQTSLAFPEFPINSLPNFIKQNLADGRRALRQSFRMWVRQLYE
jgi:Uma2 family endonuclease